MDRRFLTVLGVSLVFALVVSSVFYQMTARSNSAKRVEATDQKDVVVATRPLGVGWMIKPQDVKIEKVPGDAFPKGAFNKVEDVLDRPVISNVLLDEPILDGRLAAKGSGLGLAPTIPVGMRAVTVRVNDVAGIAGFVLPGMKVDVLVTGHPPNGDGTMTTTCLQNMLVLSAGTTMTPDPRGQTINAPTVTLLVDPEQAETLTLANSEGRIQLVLRNSSDQTIEKTSGRFVSELYGSARKPVPTKPEAAPRPKKQVEVARAPAPPPVIVAPPPPPPPPDQIVVIRGTTRTVEVMPARTNN
ncbi:MAG TPA: Flp pilus assembly protein CpaB [Bryobacteraceae bacterium]|jgi:pilus assembly protein CpaB|nr:Flp pilus assembly protein CpaB [Bryobacteraceae bacterium]